MQCIYMQNFNTVMEHSEFSEWSIYIHHFRIAIFYDSYEKKLRPPAISLSSESIPPRVLVCTVFPAAENFKKCKVNIKMVNLQEIETFFWGMLHIKYSDCLDVFV